MPDEIVTISDLVRDRIDGRVTWAIVAAYVRSEHGDPICIDYRARQVRPDRTEEPGNLFDGIVNGHRVVPLMEDHATDEDLSQVGLGSFSPKGIPRYVFEEASQGRLVEKARAQIDRRERERDLPVPEGTHVEIIGRAPTPSDQAKAILAAPARKAGRPPQRSLHEKLRILAEVELSYKDGRTLEDVAVLFHMSRSSVRDLLSWARRDASPRLFEGRGQGRKGGCLTPEARSLLSALEERTV